MAQITIEFDRRDMAEINRLFASTDKLYNQVAYRAMGKVVAGVKTDTDAEIRNVYNLKKAKVSAGIHTTTGTMQAPNMTVTVGEKGGGESGRPISLINFGAKEKKGGEVTVQVLKAGSRKTVAHAFIADGRNANRHVFMRKYRWDGKPYNPNPPWMSIRLKMFPYGALPHKFKYKIMKLTGPRLADAFEGRPQVYETIKRKAMERMKKELAYQYDMAFKNL